jgi:hypothetical protein
MRSAGTKAKNARITAAVPAIEMSHDAHGLIRSSLDRTPAGVHRPSWRQNICGRGGNPVAGLTAAAVF